MTSKFFEHSKVLVNLGIIFESHQYYLESDFNFRAVFGDNKICKVLKLHRKITSMLVTDVGYSLCWWKFEILVTDSLHWKVRNINRFQKLHIFRFLHHMMWCWSINSLWEYKSLLIRLKFDAENQDFGISGNYCWDRPMCQNSS